MIQPNKKNHQSYTVMEKLHIIALATKTNIMTASQRYGVDHSMISRWIQKKENLEISSRKSRSS